MRGQHGRRESFSWKQAFGIGARTAQEALYGQPMLHINCNGFFEIENCHGIIRYDVNHLELDMGKQRVVIEGEGICVDTFQKKLITVSGTLFSLCFSNEEE